MGAAHPHASRFIIPNSAARVAIEFRPRACCGTSNGFPDEFTTTPPPALEARGVTADDWRAWVNDYESTVAPLSNIVCWVLLLVVAWCLLIPGVIITFCCHYGRWSPFQAAARAWLDRVNERLRPRGMLAKFQTTVEDRYRHRVERSILSFAMTPDEAAVLDNEPVLVRNAACDCLGFAAVDIDRVV